MALQILNAGPGPDEVVAKTRDKYLEAYKRLTGTEMH